MPKQTRKKKSDRRTRCRRPATLDKGRRAWEMRLAGFELAAIGDELGGMTASGVHELLRGYMASVPPGAVEDYRLVILGRLDDAHAASHNLLTKSRSATVKLAALRSINQIARTFAMVSSVVKVPAPVVMVNQFARGPDLSRLSIEEVETLQRIQTKLLEAPIEAHGEVVEDVRESDSGVGEDERRGTGE